MSREIQHTYSPPWEHQIPQFKGLLTRRFINDAVSRLLEVEWVEKWKGKVKCTLVQALRLCTGHTAPRGRRGIALLFLDHGTRRGWGVSVTPRPHFTPGKDPVPILQEAGWAPGPVWTGAENLAPTGILSPDRPARSQSLYRLRYPANNEITGWWFFILG